VTLVIAVAVLFVNDAPIAGVSEPLRSVPKARSASPVAPKAYVSPVVLLPVPTAYLPSFFAAVPLSDSAQPTGRTELRAPSGVFVSALKSWVYGVSAAVRLMLPFAGESIADTVTRPVTNSPDTTDTNSSFTALGIWILRMG
jgi:hypothetical protein